jgi:hypothetical protein
LVKREGREEAGAAGFTRRRRVGCLRGEEEERKGERERLTSGAEASARAKKKKRERGRGPARGKTGGLLGRLGRKVRG